MINLLNYKDVEGILQDKLKEGWKQHEIIYTEDLRNVGKTYQLVELARKYNWIVVEPNETKAEILREKYDYKNIYGQGNVKLRKMGIVLVDELVNIEKLLKDMECDILTGFTTEKKYTGSNTRELLKKLESKSYKKEENNKLDIIDVLDNEIQLLIIKIQKARESEVWGTYKNLINALTDVMNLKNNESNNDWKLMYSEYNIGCDTDNGKSFSGKQIAVWEQNGEGQIRNNKAWNIKEENKKPIWKRLNDVVDTIIEIPVNSKINKVISSTIEKYLIINDAIPFFDYCVRDENTTLNHTKRYDCGTSINYILDDLLFEAQGKYQLVLEDDRITLKKEDREIKNIIIK